MPFVTGVGKWGGGGGKLKPMQILLSSQITILCFAVIRYGTQQLEESKGADNDALYTPSNGEYRNPSLLCSSCIYFVETKRQTKFSELTSQSIGPYRDSWQRWGAFSSNKRRLSCYHRQEIYRTAPLPYPGHTLQ